MTEREALEALLEKRLTSEELARLRGAASRAQARAVLNLRFAMLVERYREANPAAVSPDMGIA